MRTITGLVLAIFAAWVGIEAIATRDTWLWGSVSSSGGAAGLTADYRVRGVLAVVIGVGWLFAALAAMTGLAAPEGLRVSRLGYTITGVALLVFALCFVYVAAKSLLQTYPRHFASRRPVRVGCWASCGDFSLYTTEV